MLLHHSGTRDLRVLSGLGRESGTAAIEHYSQLKTVYVGMGAVEAPY